MATRNDSIYLAKGVHMPLHAIKPKFILTHYIFFALSRKKSGSIDVNQLVGRSGQIIYLICQDDVEMRVENKKNWTGNGKEGLSGCPHNLTCK